MGIPCTVGCLIFNLLINVSVGQSCNPIGYLTGVSGSCKPSTAPCCVTGKRYPQYNCSPALTPPSTRAILTNNDFSNGGIGGGASECTGKFYPTSDRVVALSTGWFANLGRCEKCIRITANNGRYSVAQVVDECDSVKGCDSKHDFEVPCGTNTVPPRPLFGKTLDSILMILVKRSSLGKMITVPRALLTPNKSHLNPR